MNEPYYTRRCSDKYIDLRNLIDDKTILRNPHKGWYYHYVDNGLASPVYRNGIKKGDHLENFPGLNHLYLRIDWADIEPEEGKFEWDWLDEIFDEWSQYGYTFSFRVCCFESGIPYATPKWVRDAGAEGTEISKKIKTPSGEVDGLVWEPDYGDPVFFEKLENMLCAFGKKYNGSKLVEFVDIGTFGTWGEGHTWYGSEKLWSSDILRRHVDLHLRYLPDTTLLLNDDIVHSAFMADGKDKALDLFEYCMGKGIGMRDDSLCVSCYIDDYGYDTMRTGQLTAAASEHAPVDLEFTHYNETNEEEFKRGFPVIEALKTTHATYAGFHGYADAWLGEQRYLCEYLANRLGYWYFITGIELPECVSGFPTLMKLNLENRGYARAYYPYTLKVYAVRGNERYRLYESCGNNLRWADRVTETLRLDFRGVPSGEYELVLGLFENDRAIKFALKEECLRGDMYALTEFTVH